MSFRRQLEGVEFPEMIGLVNKQVKPTPNSLVHRTLKRSFAAVRDLGAVGKPCDPAPALQLAAAQYGISRCFKDTMQVQGSLKRFILAS